MSSEWKENVLFIRNEIKMPLKIFSQQKFVLEVKCLEIINVRAKI